MSKDIVTAMRELLAAFLFFLFLPQAVLAQNTPASNSQSSQPISGPMPPALQQLLTRIYGEQMSFEANSVSTGATLKLREISRQHLEDRTFVKYELIVSGVSAKELYTVMRWNLNNSLEPVFKDVRVRDDGTLVCSGTTVSLCGTAKPTDPLNLNFYGTAGEALYLVLTTPKGNPLATMATVPFPLRSTNAGCTLSAILLMPEAAAILIEGAGFPPNTAVPLMGDSAGEKQMLTHETDAHGDLRFVILPSTVGKKDGTIMISPTAGACRPRLAVPWGKHSYQLQ